MPDVTTLICEQCEKEYPPVQSANGKIARRCPECLLSFSSNEWSRFKREAGGNLVIARGKAVRFAEGNPRAVKKSVKKYRPEVQPGDGHDPDIEKVSATPRVAPATPKIANHLSLVEEVRFLRKIYDGLMADVAELRRVVLGEERASA